MAKTRTFIDSGVLIAAAKGADDVAARAMAVLDDADRVFVVSDFVRLEVLPKARYHKHQTEVAFYEAFFAAAGQNITASEQLVRDAGQEAELTGLSALDALHVAAARHGGATELVTAEKPTKPIFRTTSISVKSIRPPVDDG